MASREEYLARLDLQTLRGLEIGPADRPWIPATVRGIRYADHLSTEDLRKGWAADSHYKAEDLCEISFVLDERPLRETLGEWVDLDVIAASHVVEHVPNLLNWLRELASALKPDGLLFLVAPNKRFEFDRLRRVTELADVLTTFLDKRTQPSLAAMLDCWLHFAKHDGNTTWWDEVDTRAMTVMHTIPYVYDQAKAAVERGGYTDVHVSVFTPYSFIRLIHDLTLLELMPLELIDIDAVGIEIFLMFRACPVNEDVPRRLKKLDEMEVRFPFNVEDYYSGLLLHGERLPDNVDELPGGSVRAELERVKAELERMKSSASWKVTAPLRSVRSRLPK